MGRNGDRAVIYARFSSHNQRGESIEIQVEKSREYCAEHGLQVVGVYQDAAQTGRDTKRADFQRMLSDAKRKAFDYVVIYKVTRIMRNRDEMAMLRIMLRKCGVEILYAGESIPQGSSGTLMLGLLEVLAEWESDMDSERIRDGIEKNAKRCMANGQPLFGWDIVEGRYVVNESEAGMLRMVKDMLLSGEAMADCVRACGQYRTKRGGKINQSNLTKMMRREQNAGVYNYAGYREEGGMPALWPMGEQRMIDELLSNRARPRKNWNECRFALTGKLYCGKCGEPMTGTSGTSKTGKAYHYYRCRKCGRKVRRDIIEANVVEAVLLKLGDEGTRERIADMVMEYEREEAGTPQSEIIKSDLHEIEVTFENIWKAIEKGIDPPGGKERIDALKERQTLLEEQLATARAIEAVSLNRDRVLYTLENIARADDETILDMFVVKVVLFDDDLHVAYTFDGSDVPMEAFVHDDHGGRGSPECSYAPPWDYWANSRPWVYPIWRGFVIVTRYEPPNSRYKVSTKPKTAP